MSPRKFIIDTDPGIDDAMAIFCALECHRRGEIEILAITLVSGNTPVENQSANVLRILHCIPECFGTIPVYIGAHEALALKLERPAGAILHHGANGFGDVIFDQPALDHPDRPVIQDEHAVVAINRLVNENPGQITVVTLGPMTNIALAMKLNKSFESKVKNFVIMGGNMEGVGNTTSAAEFNFYADPEAAHVVLKRLQDLDIVKAKLVTWEVCRKSYYPWEWRSNELGKIPGDRIKLMNLLDEAKRNISRIKDEWAPCDLFAMAVALDQNCVKKSTNFNATVELHGLYSRGSVILDKRFVACGQNKGTGLNVEVIQELDTDLVKKYIVQGMSKEE